MQKNISIVAALLLTTMPTDMALGQDAASPLPYRDTALDVEKRAADLVARMTLEEKAGQLKDNAPGVPRLGIPAYNWWSEGLHGVARAGNATVFPQAIALAATWDAPLVQDAADIIATEFRAKYRATVRPDGSSDRYRGLTVWSPNINIFRDPRWGRGQETFGEDPYLTSRFGVAFVRGLQGDDPAYPKTIAAAKHFAVHSGPESDRHKEDIHPSPHDLEDTYLPAFRAAIVEAKTQAVMCAYNAIDAVPACGSDLLRNRIRGRWGFNGHIVSDCAAIADFYLDTSHRYSKTPEEAVAAALNAGTDLICGEFGLEKKADPQIVVNAVRNGLLAQNVVDRAVTRLVEARIRLGMFDSPGAGPYAGIAASEFDTPAHRAKALEVARASMVLLKNDGILPLKGDPARIAVIGPNADNIDALVGNYNGTPSRPVTVLAGLRQRFPKAEISFVEGTGLVGAPLKRVPDAAFCRDARCAAPGLKVEEFAAADLAGGPVMTRTDSSVRFGWGRSVREERETSIRWTGYIVPEETGAYRFRLNSENGYRILVDGKTVVNAWDAADPASIADGKIELRAGQPYALTVEAVQKGSRGDQSFSWSNFSQRDEAAVAAARSADLVVFVGGLTARLEGEEMRVHAPGFAGGDRTSLDLPEPQEKLLERLHGTGKPVVLILMNGSALSINWADRNIPAIVEAWYPGGEGGRAVAGLLAGDFSPSGRLPITFYKSAEQLPAFKDYSMAGRTYRYFGGEVLYPFGHGLSFTRFSYGKPLLDRSSVRAGKPVAISVRVTNTGAREGDEVVQLYVAHPATGAPIRSLQGFQRVSLKQGESRDVRFVLDARALSRVDADGRRTVEPGLVNLWLGGGQPTPSSGVPGGATRLRITGRTRLED